MSNQQIPSFPPDIYNQIMAMFDRHDAKLAAQAAQWETERKERAAQWEAERAKAAAEREAERKEREEAEKKAEKKWQKQIGFLSNRIGDIIQAMVEGNIVDKFQRMGYEFTLCATNVKFRNKELNTPGKENVFMDVAGEIDLFLEDGDVAMLVEVKTTLEIADVKEHIARMEKYGRYADAKGDKRRFVAAVAGAVVSKSVREFAHQNGMYAIVQSGESVRIVPPPEGFKPQEW
jgi:Skp family chaperone for outer membrane proteins